MPILFLDFDGVLHPEHCHESRHFCCLSILEDALRQVPECQIVITSTWRLEQSYETLRKRFSPDIAAMIAQRHACKEALLHGMAASSMRRVVMPLGRQTQA